MTTLFFLATAVVGFTVGFFLGHMIGRNSLQQKHRCHVIGRFREYESRRGRTVDTHRCVFDYGHIGPHESEEGTPWENELDGEIDRELAAVTRLSRKA